MKKMALFLLGVLISGNVFANAIASLPPAQDSRAYQQYQRRPKTELSKLVYLMDRFKGSEYNVIYNQVEYDSEVALKHAKSYIAKNYRNGDAASWIKEHAYRSHSGQVIYLKSSAGKTEVLRDALIAELQRIQK